MTKRFESGAKHLQLGSNETATLKYYIVTNEIATNTDGEILTYGVEIEMHYQDQDANKRCESEICNDIVICKEEILELVRMLKDGDVTPASLSDIVEDYLAALDNPLPMRSA